MSTLASARQCYNTRHAAERKFRECVPPNGFAKLYPKAARRFQFFFRHVVGLVIRSRVIQRTMFVK